MALAEQPSSLGQLNRKPQTLGVVVALATAYTALAWLALHVFSPDGVTSYLWLPSGLAVAMLLLAGRTNWPGVMLGSLLGNAMSGTPLPVAVLMAMGNTLEAWLAATMLMASLRTANFASLAQVFILARAAIAAAAVSAFVGNAALYAFGMQHPADLAQRFVQWWVGNTLGIFLLTPLIVLGAELATVRGRRHLRSECSGGLVEALVLFTVTILIGNLVFTEPGDVLAHGHEMAPPVLVYTVLVWAAVRFGRLGAATFAAFAVLHALFFAVNADGLFAAHRHEWGLANFWMSASELLLVAYALATAIHGRSHSNDMRMATEQRTHRLIEASTDGVAIVEVKTGKVRQANPKLLQALGLGSQHVLGRDLFAFHQAGLRFDALKGDLLKVGDGGISPVARASILLPHREEQLFEVFSVGFDSGEERQVQVVFRDITARVHAQRELGASEKRYRAIVEAMSEAVFVRDVSGRITDCNRSAELMFDFCRADILGSLNIVPQWQIFAEDGKPVEQVSHVLELMRSGEVVKSCVRRVISRSMKEMWVIMNSVALSDASGKPQGRLTTITDITDTRRNDEVRAAQAAADAANVNKSRFVAYLSHELRTPLNAIYGFAQLLELDPGMAAHAKARVFVDNIKVAADRVLKMVAELLDVARIEAGRVKLEIVTFELAPVIAESTALLQGMSEERNTPLMVYMEDASCVVKADRLRTSQILLNLVSNALKYGEVDSQVMISVSSTKDAITVEVSDRGAGLSEAELGALFQPYSRPMRRSCEIEGTGLGLVVTRQLVELMGGGIEVHSEPGVGSVFAFTLPAA